MAVRPHTIASQLPAANFVFQSGGHFWHVLLLSQR